LGGQTEDWQVTSARIERPDTTRVLGRLKDFQRATVDHVFKRLFLDADSSHRYLVADEVGLGKTLVARGVIARALDHLWDSVPRIDVIYVCSNSDIARQNVNRLNVLGGAAASIASRLTMLPAELSGLRSRKVNFVSFTPATSFDLRSSTGQARERVLLYWMLRDEWDFGSSTAPLNVLQGASGTNRFREQVEWFGDDIDPDINRAFHVTLDRKAAESAARGTSTLRERFERLCDVYSRSNSRVSREDAASRNALIADLRRALAATCIRALEPDLIILDEFQRFKSLLNADDEASQLAQELFGYSDEESRARVLLLSATPYKMYTLADEAGGDDHYIDFVDTLRFLQADAAATARVATQLSELRLNLLRPDADRDTLARLKRGIEGELRRVMVRTERLAASEDRNGMLSEVPATSVILAEDEAHTYCALQDICRALVQPDGMEYWKSAPYLLNFMEHYKLKTLLVDSIEQGDGHGAVKALGKAARDQVPLLMSVAGVENQEPMDPPHARLRWLLNDTINRGAWRLLWIPPSLPYYAPDGPFAEPQLSHFTKRLMFSAWHVVPKAIASLISYEAERRMLQGSRRGDETRTRQLERVGGLLKTTRSDGRLSGMPVLALLYPSVTLSRLGDPLRLTSPSDRTAFEELRSRVGAVLRPLLQQLTVDAPSGRAVDESWYWAAPVLLDLASDDSDAARIWLLREHLSVDWLGEHGGDEDERSGWHEHVLRFQDIASANGKRSLGAVPADLVDVLASLAIAGPAVCAQRALARSDRFDGCLADMEVRDSGAVVAHGLRGLFNLPDVTSLVRSIVPGEPYWRRVLDYCAMGNLQAVLDEYVHVLREAEGLVDSPAPEIAAKLASKIREAIGLRTSRLGVDDIRVNSDDEIVITKSSMRSRFAMRFGEEQTDLGEERTRADHVRTAFNSPFWPFVLSSTSVGQEGLDFHLYCHAVVHWNLPSNPVDMEQREGRVHRYKGHAVRKNIARAFASRAGDGSREPWERLFDSAQRSRDARMSDLIPFWLYPIENGAVIERHVPNLPLSRDVIRYAALRRSLAIYRMVFGQPRQDELVEFLLARGAQGTTLEGLDLRIDLAPTAGDASIPAMHE
jgi:hypothetical protein